MSLFIRRKFRFARVLFSINPLHARHWRPFSAHDDCGRIGRFKWVNSDTENDAWGWSWWGNS